jgi:alginate O-acetyltransferase complex protein AlgI
MTKRYLFLDLGGSDTIPLWLAAIGPVLLLCQLMMRRMNFGERVCSLSLPRFAFLYGGAWALSLSLLPLGYRPFIYFQF